MESGAGRYHTGRYLVAHYLAALSAGAVGLCGGGWLVLTPFAFGYPWRGREAVTALATGGGLVVVSSLTMLCWSLAWRRRLRADAVLESRSVCGSRQRKAQRRSQRETRRLAERSAKRQARAERLVRASRQRELAVAPDPAQVLTDLRALLTPLLSAADESVSVVPAPEPVPELVSVVVAAATDRPAMTTPEASREVQAPGHLRGTRSASFFAVPKQAAPEQGGSQRGDGGPGDSLMRGAELLMVGTGEEESW